MKTLILPTTLVCLALSGQVFAAKVIPNNPIADLVLGQADFVTKLVAPVTSSFSLTTPNSVVIDPISRKVFVSDRASNRILRYPNVSSLTNGAGAEAVFGQPRFSSTTAGSGDLGLDTPTGLFFDRFGRLWVADKGNNRVLMYEAASYRETQAYADRVYGQANFATNAAGTTAATMRNPYFVQVDASDRLWVSDTYNHRILRFDSISTKPNGAAADTVLGQINFTSGAGGATASKVNYPLGVAVSSTGALFVGDWGSHRVLRFDNAATLSNGSDASVVFGHMDFTSTAPGLDFNRMNHPWGLWITPNDELWVNDELNSRLIRFSSASTKNTGSAADGVVGQPNFMTNTATTTNRGLATSECQPFVDAGGNLWAADSDNNRVLRFPPDITKPLLTLTGTVPKKTTKKNVVIKGTASDTYGISKVQYRIGTGVLKTASGTTSWQFAAPLKKGKNTITIIATDSVGNVSLSKVVKIKRS